MAGGIITTVPLSADEAKKMGKDLINKQGGPMLAKLTGTDVVWCREGSRVSVHEAICKHFADMQVDM